MKPNDQFLLKMTFHSSWLRGWPALDDLETVWNDLLSSSSSNTIFLTWEWMKTWGEVVGKSIDPIFLVIRDETEKILGIIPLYNTAYILSTIVPYRMIRTLGDFASGMEYADWIVDENREQDISRCMVAALENCPITWDSIWIPTVAGWTGIEERISRSCMEHGFLLNSRPRLFACFELPNKSEEYWSSLSGNRRQELRAQTKRIYGKKDVYVTRCTDKEDIPRYLGALFDLHNKRWNKVGKQGTFQRKPNEELFYRRFAPIAFEKGWLRIFGLVDNGEFKAVQIGYVYNNTFFQMQEGFDPDYEHGVGNILRMRVIEACIQEGLQIYDFMGEMTEHKRRWGARQRTGFDILIGRRNLMNRILFGLNVWPTGRYLVPVDLPNGLRS